jgi:hypothetical protein
MEWCCVASTITLEAAGPNAVYYVTVGGVIVTHTHCPSVRCVAYLTTGALPLESVSGVLYNYCICVLCVLME